MIKKLCTILLFTALIAPVGAQSQGGDKDGVVFAPRKGQWQVSLVLGKSSPFYNEGTGSYLLPNYNMTSGEIGLPNGSTNLSGDLGAYLNLGGFNGNNLLDVVGLQGKYFFADCWDINFALGMNISATPKKDYVEGDYQTVPDMIVPAQKYINAQTTNNWYVSVGTDRYFKTRNARIHPYIGAVVGFQMARIETVEPYTGKVVYDEEGGGTDTGSQGDAMEGLPEHVYLAAGKAGQMFGINAGLVGGIEYSIAKGVTIGLECRPVAYRYDVIQICPKGFDKYNVQHHNIKLVDMPVLKFGFRF